MAKYFLEVTIIKIYEKYGNIVFALPSLAAAIIFGFCVCVCVCVWCVSVVSEALGYEMFYEGL